MPPSSSVDLDYRPSYRAAVLTSLGVMVLYFVTLSPSTAMWDTSEYIAAACTLGLPHPPGNPLFVLIGRVFCILPLAASKAVRLNMLAALAGAASAGLWFLVCERILVGWLAERWQRVAGGVLAAVIGSTAFTVWNQSVVNEKVYTISLFGLALISWLSIRWSDDPDGPVADRILVLIAYLLGLGFANHMMGFLAAPAVIVAVIVRKPSTILRWPLLLACAGAVLLGMTPFLTQPIRAAYFPPVNEGEPTACMHGINLGCTLSSETYTRFMDNFMRRQYGKPDVFDRQAPFLGQLGMYKLYFTWQWMRAMDATRTQLVVQQILAAVYFVLGMFGAYVHWKRDRRSFWYFSTFMATLTILLIWYLNFRFGYSQEVDAPSDAREVRDRDYFFIVSFSAWGVWASLGLVYLWEALAALIGSERVKVGKETLDLPKRQSWLVASPILAFALVPLFTNWHAASRHGQTDTRDVAADMLNSVEPYGILVTAGDNDTFPLWYAQEVEGIRKDVVIANTSLLNTDWYTRQLIRRPVFEYDAEHGPAIYKGKSWPKPTGSVLKMSIAQADAVQPYYQLSQPQLFRQGTIEATLPPQTLFRSDFLVLQMIHDSYPQRPMYFAVSTANSLDNLGLNGYMLQQGLARKLTPQRLVPGRDTVALPGQNFMDLPRSKALWNDVFQGQKALLRRGDWVDKASISIPYMYVSTGLALFEAEQQVNDTAAANRTILTVQKIANAVGLGQIVQQAVPPPRPVPPGDKPLSIFDSTKKKP